MRARSEIIQDLVTQTGDYATGWEDGYWGKKKRENPSPEYLAGYKDGNLARPFCLRLPELEA